MGKKVLFACYGLGIGGIETCLVNLLNKLSDEDMDIDLLLMNPIYDLQDRIKAKNVRILPVFDYVLNTTDVMSYIGQNGGIAKNITLFLRYVFYRVAVKLRLQKPWMIFKRLQKHYDVAIAYSANGSTLYYVMDKVDADKKILWNHNGVYEQSDKAYARDKQYIPKFDKIVSASTDAMKNLCRYFPIEEKSLALKNIVDVDLIRGKANEFYPKSYDDGFIHIVTVGRLVEVKQPCWAIDICKRLTDNGCKVKWHWVGNGNLESEIRKIIVKKNLEDVFILEGDQLNPYPYISNADIYVQSSRYEAYSTTITEAKVLCKPIITTDVGGMRDQIENEVNGIITEVTDEALFNGVKALLDNEKLRENIIHNLKKEKYDNLIKPYMDNIFD